MEEVRVAIEVGRLAGWTGRPETCHSLFCPSLELTLPKLGTIEFKELRHVLEGLGDQPTDEEIQEMIMLVDENGDGEVDFDEFLTLMRLRLGESGDDAEQNLRDVFNLFDADGSGFIDHQEMRVMMKKLAQDLTEEEISQIIECVDKDDDGEISFEEFKSLIAE